MSNDTFKVSNGNNSSAKKNEREIIQEAIDCGVDINVAYNIHSRPKSKTKKTKPSKKEFEGSKPKSKDYGHETIRQINSYLDELEKEELQLEKTLEKSSLANSKIILSLEDLKNS